MKFKIPYKCIIYDIGDMVYPKYPNLNSIAKVIESVRMDVIGSGTIVQFLKFQGDISDDLNISNHYVPYGIETRNKYNEGLNYYNGYDVANDKILVTKGDTKVVPMEKASKSKIKAVADTSQSIIFKPIKKSP